MIFVTGGAGFIGANFVLDWLAQRGYADVKAVTAAEESLLFALPMELRRDLKAAARVVRAYRLEEAEERRAAGASKAQDGKCTS